MYHVRRFFINAGFVADSCQFFFHQDDLARQTVTGGGYFDIAIFRTPYVYRRLSFATAIARIHRKFRQFPYRYLDPRNAWRNGKQGQHGFSCGLQAVEVGGPRQAVRTSATRPA